MNLINRLHDDGAFLRKALYLALALGLLVRLWNISAPIADRHSWNQVSTATVIRHFAEDGIDPLHPQWDVLEGSDTDPRIEAEEAPLYHIVAALGTRLLGSLEILARLLSILGSLLGAVFLFRLTRRLADGPAALFAVCFYLFAPFSWFFGRAIMSDAWMLAAMIAAVERFEAWTESGRFGVLLQAAVAVALAGLFKPFALHVGVALLLLQINRRGLRSLIDWRLVVFVVVSLVPPLAWVWWAAQIGTLGNVVDSGQSMLTAEHLWGPLSLLWSPRFWFKIQARIFDQAATPIVTALALLALVGAFRRCRVALFWLAGFLVYLLLVRDGNQMHNYYQLPVVPPLALLAGIGLSLLSQMTRQRWIALVLVGFVVVAGLYVRTSFELDLSSQKAGELVGQFSQPGELIVVLDPGATRKNQAIYAAHRRGWHLRAVHEGQVEKHRDWGARWLVTCLEDSQIAKHPEWIERLATWPKIKEIRGDFGRRGKPHTIAIYDLSATP